MGGGGDTKCPPPTDLGHGSRNRCEILHRVKHLIYKIELSIFQRYFDCYQLIYANSRLSNICRPKSQNKALKLLIFGLHVLSIILNDFSWKKIVGSKLISFVFLLFLKISNVFLCFCNLLFFYLFVLAGNYSKSIFSHKPTKI